MGQAVGQIFGGKPKQNTELLAAQQRQLERSESQVAEEERKRQSRIAALTARSRGRNLLLSDESRGNVRETLG